MPFRCEKGRLVAELTEELRGPDDEERTTCSAPTSNSVSVLRIIGATTSTLIFVL